MILVALIVAAIVIAIHFWDLVDRNAVREEWRAEDEYRSGAREENWRVLRRCHYGIFSWDQEIVLGPVGYRRASKIADILNWDAYNESP